MLRAVIAALALVVGVAAACGDEGTRSTATPAPSGGVRGTVLIDTPCASPNPSGDPCAQPYAADIVVQSGIDGAVVSRVTAGTDGVFEVTLPAGEYVLVPQPGDPFPQANAVPVSVVAGQYADAEINYDSGGSDEPGPGVDDDAGDPDDNAGDSGDPGEQGPTPPSEASAVPAP